MLGNDVVDLADVDADVSTYSPRFDERVFTDIERAQQGSASDPARARWSTWAAKEAAFKAVKRERPRTVFSPAAFEVVFEDSPRTLPNGTTRFSARVTCGSESRGEERIRVDVDVDEAHVHAVARGEGELAPDFEVASLPLVEGPGELDPSTFVRRRLARKLAAELGVRVARITFDRRARIPIVLLDGREVPIEASLSHHGRFVACAWSPRGVRRVRAQVRPVSRPVRKVCA